MEFAAKLKYSREKTGKTQNTVATELGLLRQTYNHYESGKRQPDFETLVRISEYFKVSIDFLLKGDVASYKSVESVENDSFLDITLDREIMLRLEACLPLLHIFKELPETAEKALLTKYTKKLASLNLSHNHIENWHLGDFHPAPAPFVLKDLLTFYETEEISSLDEETATQIKRSVHLYGTLIRIEQMQKELAAVSKIKKEEVKS